MYSYLLGKGQVSTNDLREWGRLNFVAEPCRRARELAIEGRVGRRDITPEEMARYGYKTKVRVYFIPPIEVKSFREIEHEVIGKYLFTDMSAEA